MESYRQNDPASALQSLQNENAQLKAELAEALLTIDMLSKVVSENAQCRKTIAKLRLRLAERCA